MSVRLAEAVKNAAVELGVSPNDLATVFSYETAGTFDEWKAGPTTQWGQHFGLIQWGEPQRRKYGVYKGMPVEDQVTAAVAYLKDAGVQPGMGLVDIYSAVNAGSVGRHGASDANNGGAPGTVADKVNFQMEGHKAKAAALLGGEFFPEPMNPYEGTVGSDAPPINPATYQQHSVTAPPTLVEQTAQEAQQPKGYETWGDQLYDSAAQTVTADLFRWATQGEVDPFDKGWSADEWSKITETLPKQYHDYVLTGSSEQNRLLRLQYAQEMAGRDERRAASGVSSTLLADLLTGISDPVLLPLVAATGGLRLPAQMTSSLVRQVASGALLGSTSNAAIELGSKYGLDDPNADALGAFGAGALLGGLVGPIALNRATRTEADMLAKAGLDAIAEANRKATVSAPDGLTITDRTGSAGAARNTELLKPFDPADWGIEDADVDRGFGGRLRFDVAGQLTTSENPRARLAGLAIFEESAGTVGHSVQEAPASVRAVALERKLMGNRNLIYQQALREYVTEEGAILNPIARARKAEQFHHAVNAYMSDPHRSPAAANKFVVRAAEARREFYASWADEIGRAFPDRALIDRGYVPKIADHGRISELDRAVDAETMESFLAEAIRRAHDDIDEAIVKKMAKGYWTNIRRAGYGMSDGFSPSLSLGDRDGFKRALRESLDEATGLSDEEADRVFDSFAGILDGAKRESDGSKGISRLKRRTVMDYSFAARVRTRDGGSRDISVEDLFIQDAEFIDHRYARTMSGRVAFADTRIKDPKTGDVIFDGIRSEGDLEKLKNWVREGFRQLGKPLAEVQGAMDNAIENIDFGWKRVNGIPVQGQEKNYAQWVRRLKAMQFVRLMSNMGLNQVQESWKVAAMTGFRAALSQLPAVRRIADEAGRSVPNRDALLGELEHMTGIGLDGLVGKFDFRLADDRIGAAASSGLANYVDVGLDWGQRITTQASLMRHIHDYQQKWAAKAVSQHLLDIARSSNVGDSFDLSRLGRGDRDRLASVGIGDNEARLVFGNLLRHAETDGRKLVSLGSTKWDPEAVTTFSHTVNRYTDRLVQRNDVGGLAKWMSDPVKSLFVQFRSFVLGAWSKSTLYAVNHMDPRMAVLLAGELAFGTATYAVRSSGQLATEDGREKFWDETMDPVNLAKNGWARTATASVLPMLMDSALLMTPVGPQFGSARASGTPQDALLGAPVGDHLATVQRFARGSLGALSEDREMTKGELSAGYRAFVPLANFLPFAALFSHLVKDAPERKQ